ncbi:MAG: hypothetical protein DRO09_02360 [Thermoprotei archaeon]|nr:MAG: hypothetical protein DRO09_02360 [Thermoprotei archaeon]
MTWRNIEETIRERIVKQRELTRKVRELCIEASLKCSGVLACILYGSLARLEFGERSDIDVLFIVEDRKAGESIRREIVGREPYITPLIMTLEEWLEAPLEFQLEIISDGIILYASNITIKDLVNAEPYTLVKYSVKGLPPQVKNKINYLVSGAKVKVKSKLYKSTSPLERQGGLKLWKSTILVPYKSRDYTENTTINKILQMGAKIEKKLQILVNRQTLKKRNTKHNSTSHEVNMQ